MTTKIQFQCNGQMLPLICKSRRGRAAEETAKRVHATESTDACLRTATIGQTRLLFFHLKKRKVDG